MSENDNNYYQEVEEWVRYAINLGYEWDTILTELVKRKLNAETVALYKEMFELEKARDDKITLSIGDKRALKRNLKLLKQSFANINKRFKKIKDITKKEEIETSREVLAMKEQMIMSIVGEKGKVEGLLDIFDIEEEDGKEVILDKKTLRAMPVQEVTDIYEDLLNELEKNI